MASHESMGRPVRAIHHYFCPDCTVELRDDPGGSGLMVCDCEDRGWLYPLSWNDGHDYFARSLSKHVALSAAIDRGFADSMRECFLQWAKALEAKAEPDAKD